MIIIYQYSLMVFSNFHQYLFIYLLIYLGLQCTEEHIVFLAKQGIEDMLYACNGNAERVLPSLPKLVRPLRNALSKFNVPILLNVLTVI